MIGLQPSASVVMRRPRARGDEREGWRTPAARRFVRGAGSRRSLAVHLRNCGSRAARSSPTLRRKSASRARTRVFAGELASGKSLGARYYAPWLGRWTTADPLGLQAGLNLYLYGRASPINFVDPSGTFDVPAVLREAAEPYVAAGKAVASEAVRQGELRAAAPDIGAIIDQSVQGQLQAQADAELIGRVAGRQGLSEFEIGNLTRPAPKGEAPPGFLRGFFREMTGEGVREGPARGLPGDVSTGLLADIANTAVRLGETGAETAVTPSEEASDEAAGRFAFNFLKLASYAVGLGETGAAAKSVQAGAAEVRGAAGATRAAAESAVNVRFPSRSPLRFAHGTSPESAGSVVEGLSAEGAIARSKGGTALEPGSFFAHEIGSPSAPGEGLQLAYEWGLRHSPNPAVVIGEIPGSTANRLLKSGGLRVLDVPGLPGVKQLVFSPKSFPTVNKSVTWLQVLRF